MLKKRVFRSRIHVPYQNCLPSIVLFSLNNPSNHLRQSLISHIPNFLLFSSGFKRTKDQASGEVTHQHDQTRAIMRTRMMRCLYINVVNLYDISMKLCPFFVLLCLFFIFQRINKVFTVS